MDTRSSKRSGKAEDDNEANVNPKLLQEVEEDLAQEFEEVPAQPKKRKPIRYSPKKKMSPTGTLELARLKEQTKMDRQKIEHLEERVNYLEEANRDLKADKDFLLAQIRAGPSTLASTGKDSSCSSSSEEEEKKKKRKKSKKKTKKSKKHSDSYSRSRMTTTDGVIRRYKHVLCSFRKSGSMKKAFAKMNVDRNTIARTAVIAELAKPLRKFLKVC